MILNCYFYTFGSKKTPDLQGTSPGFVFISLAVVIREVCRAGRSMFLPLLQSDCFRVYPLF